MPSLERELGNATSRRIVSLRSVILRRLRALARHYKRRQKVRIHEKERERGREREGGGEEGSRVGDESQKASAKEESALTVGQADARH